MTMRQPRKSRLLSRPFATAHVSHATIIIALILATLAAPSAATAQRPGRLNLDEWERIDRKDLPEDLQEWLAQVDVIITEDEEETFLRLESEFQREEFMKQFWLQRDPSAGTPQNEYYDEYQRRLEHVARMFSRDTPREGRETDRGRMYLMLGEPTTIKRLHNTREAVPVEIWWYHANPKLGIPPFFSLAFFQRSGLGEFQLYSPLMDGPLKLLNADGQRQANSPIGRQALVQTIGEGSVGRAYDVLLNVDPELAQVALSFFPNDVGGLVGNSSAAMRSEIMIGDIEYIPTRMMPDARWAYRILTGVVEADVRFESLPIRARAFALVDSTGNAFLHYGVMTEGQRLNLNNYEDKWFITFEISGWVVDEQNRVITSVSGTAGEPSKFLEADLQEEDARRLRSGPIVYLDRLPLVDGTFEFDLVLENNLTGEYGRDETRLRVPSPMPSTLQSSPAILVWDVYTDQQYDAYDAHYPFQVGPYTMIPALDNTFLTDAGIYIFRQIYVPRSHSDRIVLTYRLENDAGIVIDRTEYANVANADRFGTVNHGTRINVTDVAPGDYRLFVDVQGDASAGEVFDITLRDPSDAEARQPFIYLLPGPPPTDPIFALDRARQLRTLGRIDEAIPMLQAALLRVEDEEFIELQIELLMEAGRFAEVRELLQRVLVENPNNVAMLEVIGLASSSMGDQWDAIRYYERARILAEEESTELLNPLASAYYADNRIDKAREMLQLSLQINPDQPQIQRLLDELLNKR